MAMHSPRLLTIKECNLLIRDRFIGAGLFLYINLQRKGGVSDKAIRTVQ